MKLLGLKIEKIRKPKTQKQIKKDAKQLKKKVASTLDWIDIESIYEDLIVLNKGKEKVYVKGIKIRPINIFIMAPEDQMIQVSLLRNVFNDVPFKIYHGFVFSPVNLDGELARLMRKLEFEEITTIRTLIENDIEKMLWFINSWKEIEFFMYVSDSNIEAVDKKLDRLTFNMRSAQFIIEKLNRIDFENYTAYLFENQLINDYMFSHGAFEVLNEDLRAELPTQKEGEVE